MAARAGAGVRREGVVGRDGGGVCGSPGRPVSLAEPKQFQLTDTDVLVRDVCHQHEAKYVIHMGMGRGDGEGLVGHRPVDILIAG